jgi:hypothetical protein
MTTPRQNSWLARYGEKRRAIDRTILAEVERSIRQEETSFVQAAINPVPPVNNDAERERIARAFGRPLR